MDLTDLSNYDEGTAVLNLSDTISQMMMPNNAQVLMLQHKHPSECGRTSWHPTMIVGGTAVTEGMANQQVILLVNGADQAGELLRCALQLLFDGEAIEALTNEMSVQTARMELSGSLPEVFDMLPEEAKEQFEFPADRPPVAQIEELEQRRAETDE